MPWQQLVADVGGEIDPSSGLPAYREVVVTVPRQEGKTTLFLSWQIHRSLSPRWVQPQRSVFTAQSGKDARDKWLDEIYPMIKASSLFRFVDGGDRGMNRGMGNESIRWRTGSLIRLLSTSTSSGHSKTLHQAVEDELWHDTDERREQGLRPAMVTVPDAQLLTCSTAGTTASVVLNRKVAAGRRAVEEDRGSGICYVEFSAPADWDPADDAAFFGFMPALCPDPPCRCGGGRWRHTKTLDVVRQERDAMDPAEFARAYGNVHPTLVGPTVLDVEGWARLADEQSRPVDPVAFAVDVNPDRSRSTIAVGGVRADGLGHVELVDYRPGTGWVRERLVDLVARWRPCAVVIDGAGPAGSLVADLERAGLELVFVSARDAVQACGAFVDAVAQGTVRHRPADVLDAAVSGATTRPLGDAWAWARRGTAVDICPLVAATLALWGWTVHGGKAKARPRFAWA